MRGRMSETYGTGTRHGGASTDERRKGARREPMCTPGSRLEADAWRGVQLELPRWRGCMHGGGVHYELMICFLVCMSSRMAVVSGFRGSQGDRSPFPITKDPSPRA